MRHETIAGSDNVAITVAVSPAELTIGYRLPGSSDRPKNIFLALGTRREIGAAVLPFAQDAEGSTVFLPFKADLLLSAEIRGRESVAFVRRWKRWRWSEREQVHSFDVIAQDSEVLFRIPRALTGDSATIDFAIYAKDPEANKGWGWFWGCSDHTIDSGSGDKYIPHYHEIGLTEDAPLVTRRGRYESAGRVRIYQLFVRLFGNTNETRKRNGTLAQNGVGKFNDINEKAIASLREMGFTHVWLTGVFQQITGTDYSAIGKPADDADLLKGLAGSPYAIKDYFDVSPDYAEKPEERLTEFKALIDRLHRFGLKVLTDFVPNHVARSYDSTVRPDLNFGLRGQGDAGDDRSKFFDPQNNFFYLQLGEGPPLRLPTRRDGIPLSPTCQVEGIRCDGLFAGELDHGKVTGNNAATWSPSLNDWYETVKLNYGFNFMDPSQAREYPSALTPDKPIPDTWLKMDRVIEYWQEFGVDGFRCDMSHMVPPEFWNWLIHRARQRAPEVVFIAEAYDNDPAKVPGSDPIISRLNGGRGNVMFDLLNAGFDAVYDDPTYKTLKNICDGQGWANDIDHSLGESFIFENSLRYAENHDEVRLAAPSHWAGIGMEGGRPVAAILYGLSRGPAMLYSGQEVGEPAAGLEGFGGDDARTSIFDYWSMPELVKWANDHKYDGGRLSSEQKALREFYGRLIHLVDEPAFRDGKFFPLNSANHDNPAFGRVPGESASGHWLYAFLRYDPLSGQRFLVIANLHPVETFRNIRVRLPDDALRFLDLDPKSSVISRDRLSDESLEMRATPSQGIAIGTIPALNALYLELE